MTDRDDDLLARLNALKPSSVKLKSAAKGPSIDVEVSKPLSPEDKLAERLKGLRSGAATSGEAEYLGNEAADILTTRIKDEIATEKDPFKDWQRNEDDEKVLDELLADIGPDDQWKLNEDDTKDIDRLLKEARNALPPQQETTSVLSENHEEARTSPNALRENDEGERSDGKPEDQQDEEEADDYVKRVLATLEVEKKYGNEDCGTVESEVEPSDNALVLPSAPADITQPPTSPEPPSYEDSELEARFSKLALDLPSTPNTTPSSMTKPARLSNSKATSNVPKYTDGDIDSWCCICVEDGEVKCLGCDGDIYCQKCWREGHGDGPGQERGHRAVQYNRKGSAAAAA